MLCASVPSGSKHEPIQCLQQAAMQGASSTPHFGQEKGGALKAQGHNRMVSAAQDKHLGQKTVWHGFTSLFTTPASSSFIVALREGTLGILKTR